MELYKVDMNYYNYLHYFESKIPYIENEKQNRPFTFGDTFPKQVLCNKNSLIL